MTGAFHMVTTTATKPDAQTIATAVVASPWPPAPRSSAPSPAPTGGRARSRPPTNGCAS